MQKVLTAAEIREVDRLTTEKYGIPPLILMENAAHAAAAVIGEKLGGSVEDKSVLILCGKGNNGGDGAALTRVLWQEGADVEVCLFGLVADTKNEARTNFEVLQKITNSEGFELDQADLAFEEIASLEEWLEYDSLNFQLEDPDVIVDTLLAPASNARLTAFSSRWPRLSKLSPRKTRAARRWLFHSTFPPAYVPTTAGSLEQMLKLM